MLCIHNLHHEYKYTGRAGRRGPGRAGNRWLGLQPRARPAGRCAPARPQAVVAGCAGGRRASRASWTGPGTAGSCISFRPPTLPEEMEGGGRGLVRGGMRGCAFSLTLIRAAEGTCCHGPVASTPADALMQPFVLCGTSWFFYPLMFCVEQK